MEPPVQPFDLQRMVFGDESLLFLAEIIVRTGIVYLYSVLLLRWIGGRTVGQLSLIEFMLVIALGSAVGDPMFYPDVPLAHALLVVTLVILIDKAMDNLFFRVPRAETYISGASRELVTDGRICFEALADLKIGHRELFQQLRSRGVDRLGCVAHAYFEPNGELSVFKRRTRKPSLGIVPPWEITMPDELHAGKTSDGECPLACPNCGETSEAAAGQTLKPCGRCGGDTWHIAR